MNELLHFDYLNIQKPNEKCYKKEIGWNVLIFMLNRMTNAPKLSHKNIIVNVDQ